MIPTVYVVARDRYDEYSNAMDDMVSEAEEIRRHNLESCRYVFKINRLIDDFNAHCLARKQRYEANAVYLSNAASDMKRLLRHKYKLAQAICGELGEPDLEHEMEEEESEEDGEEDPTWTFQREMIRGVVFLSGYNRARLSAVEFNITRAEWAELDNTLYYREYMAMWE